MDKAAISEYLEAVVGAANTRFRGVQFMLVGIMPREGGQAEFIVHATIPPELIVETCEAVMEGCGEPRNVSESAAPSGSN